MNNKTHNGQKKLVQKTISKKVAALAVKKSVHEKIKITESSVNKRLSKYNHKEILVEIRGMDVVFGRKKTIVHAVKNMNLNIYKGEVLGIVGESGSGKSTTGNAILGLINRKAGSLKIKGREIPAHSKMVKGDIHQFLVRNVQMIFQDPASSLNPYKNIYKIVSEGLKNVNLKEIYAKTFDSITATTLSKMLKNKKQPPSLGKISLEWINKQIEEDKLDLVIKNIYVTAMHDLQKMQVPYARKAATYLEQRKRVRDEFVESTSSKRKIEERLVIDIINSVGLSESILSRYPLEFSGGQQQRIGISRAVILKPELIVADEPISALDVSIQAQVVNIFNDLKAKLSLTIVFIAHDLRMVEYISDRIVVMYKGTIVEVGTSKEISTNPIHPYTKSLIYSIPTIDKINQSLRSKPYDQSEHDYTKQAPKWFSINETNSREHYVLGSKEEVIQWTRGQNEESSK